MKLRNKKTGEKAEVEINYNSMLVTYEDGRIVEYYFDSLKDLEEWEDMPEEEWRDILGFEQFEKILYSIGSQEDIPGAAEHGSDDFYVKLWRCYSNDKVCQVHKLYDEITKFIEFEREIARLKGQNEVLRQVNSQLKGGEE